MLLSTVSTIGAVGSTGTLTLASALARVAAIPSPIPPTRTAAVTTPAIAFCGPVMFGICTLFLIES